jgi:nucleotide-binding universal stress UspA family protein
MKNASRFIARVLVGYDGSSSAQRALQFADQLARFMRAQLHIVAVAEPHTVSADVEGRALIEQSRRQCRQALRAARLKLSRPAHSRVMIGNPARQLIRYAQAHHIDHIVVGHRTRILLGYPMIGPVIRQIVALAPCAVTVVPGDTAFRPAGVRVSSADRSDTSLQVQHI